MIASENHFSITHFECEIQKCPDPRVASRWAWQCLENLAVVFCEYFCDRSICSMDEGIIENTTKYQMATSVQERREQWEDAQRKLHEAMAHLPKLKMLIDACPACAIAEAFSCFPILARHSPRYPVATIRMNAVDCYPEIAFCGGDQRASVPCFVIKTDLGNCETEIEEYLRESALLKLNVSELPPMPPSEVTKIKSKFVPGQTVAKRLNILRNSAPSEEELKSKEFQEHLAPIIVGVLSLRDLNRILYYYPDAIDEKRAMILYNELVALVDESMNHEMAEPFKLLYTRPEYNNNLAEEKLTFLVGILATRHPKWDLGDESFEHIRKALQGILQECIELSIGRLKAIINELINAKMNRCLVPIPVGDSSYREQGRFFQMLGCYWSLCKRIITHRMSAGIYSPDAISSLVENLRKRMELCFAELFSLEGATHAQDALFALLDACVSPEDDGLSVVEEWWVEETHKVDFFLASANLAVKLQEYPLTFEEQYFVEHAEHSIDVYHARLDKEWKSIIGNQVAMKKRIDDIVQKNDAAKRSKSTKGVAAFPTPPNATWSDVSIRFKDNHTVSVKVKTVSRIFHYAQMGMANKKNSAPTKQWDLLHDFADEHGILDWSSKKADRLKQKRREILAKNLREFFLIEGDPFSLTDDGKGWQARFSITPED